MQRKCDLGVCFTALILLSDQEDIEKDENTMMIKFKLLRLSFDSLSVILHSLAQMMKVMMDA